MTFQKQRKHIETKGEQESNLSETAQYVLEVCTNGPYSKDPDKLSMSLYEECDLPVDDEYFQERGEGQDSSTTNNQTT